MQSEYITELGSIKIDLNEVVINELRRGSIPDEKVMAIVRDHLVENIKFEIERMIENYCLDNERNVVNG